LQSNLHFLIDHIARRIEYAESRRSALAAVAGALLAAGIALLAMVKDTGELPPLRNSLVAFGLSVILLSLLMLLVYSLQTNFRYPFIKATRTSKWFYRYALERPEAFRAPWYALASRRLQEEGKQEFEKQWRSFVTDRLDDLKDLKRSNQQDLAQVFLLHVNERYKNLFLTHLRTILSTGLIVCVAVGTLTFVTSLLFEPGTPRIASGLYRSIDLTLESSWRDTGSERTTGFGGEEVQVLLNANIRNLSTSQLTLKGLVSKDSVGLTVPMTVQSIIPSPLAVPPSSNVQVVALVWIPSPLRRQLHHFEPSQ